MENLIGGLEGGGTKFVCAVGTGPGNIVAELNYKTTEPDQTLDRAVQFFGQFQLSALGIASFGPIDLDRNSGAYGYITKTPKPGWSNANILGFFTKNFNIPIAFDLDVSAAAFGEYKYYYRDQGVFNLAYFTIGTGIGAGFLFDGKLLHGLSHPEAGHIFIPHDTQKDPFIGLCPFHKDCFEGLASGRAIEARWNCKGEDLPEHHPAWDLETDYIASTLVNIILTHSPQMIILGGGVMQRPHLFPIIRHKVKKIINGYISSPVFITSLDTYIVPPRLGNKAGVLGAMALAQSLLKGEK